MLKTVVLLNIVETVMHFVCQDSQMNRKFKRTAFTVLEIERFCKIINDFTVTFNQFNAFFFVCLFFYKYAPFVVLLPLGPNNRNLVSSVVWIWEIWITTHNSVTKPQMAPLLSTKAATETSLISDWAEASLISVCHILPLLSEFLKGCQVRPMSLITSRCDQGLWRVIYLP